MPAPVKISLPPDAGEAPAPLYQRVKEVVVARIIAGDWAEGSKGPSENEVTRSLGVSGMTVHRALRELTSDGWIERIKGAGSFVAGAKPQSAVLAIKSIADEITARGNRHSAELHLLRRERAAPFEAGQLQIDAGAPLFHSIIVHRENGVPIQLEDRYVNPAAAPDYLAQDFTAITPYDYLVAAAPITDAEHTIIAVTPKERERRLLDMAEHAPCLLLRRKTWSGKTAVTWALLYHPGDRYRLGGRFQGPG